MIRNFSNSDLPHLHRIWLEHWSQLGPPPQVREAQLEQAILARSFFRAEQLLVLCRDESPIGWLEAIQHPREEGVFVIPAIVACNEATEEDVSHLLDECLRRLTAAGAGRIDVGVVHDRYFGYAGLDPIGFGCGISQQDYRVDTALRAAGFAAAEQAVSYIISVDGFRPPMNREALQFRRSSRIETALHRPDSPREAAGVSHLDIERHRLVQRDASVVTELQGWYSDPEAEVMNPSRMILDLGENCYESGELDSGLSYLIGAVIQIAAERNITSAETVVAPAASSLTEGLTKLHFRAAAQGVRWTRSF